MSKSTITIENLPSVIAGFSAAILVISVSYDFGFLFFLGISFAEAPTSLSDHIRASLIWAPKLLIIVFGVTIIELFNRRIEQGMSEEELISTSPTPRFTAWFRDSPKYLIYVFALALPLTLFFNMRLPIETWMFGSMIWWLILHNFFFNHQRVLEKTRRQVYLISRWLPVTLLFVIFNGASAAKNVPNGSSYIFEIDGKVEQKSIARIYEHYFMLWNSDTKSIEFVPKEAVKSFRQSPKEIPDKPIKSMDTPSNSETG